MVKSNRFNGPKAGTFGGLLAATYFLEAPARAEFFYRLPHHRQEAHWLALQRECDARNARELALLAAPYMAEAA